jgi:tRNA(Ile)-lysidine synthase
MRMINGHRMFGLRGMKRDSDIPECHGMHGIHESGALASRADQTMAESVHVLRRGHDTRRNRPTTKIPLATEMGGVRVYRPLLDFTKDRLVDTCKAAKMEWFEDHTNKDPTITMRNAIRYMYSAHKVPAALAPPSILSISAKFEKKYVHLQKVANSLFEAANKLFMTRSGTMRIQFPDLRLLESSLSSDEINLVASLLLRQAISFVTSREHARLQSLHGSVDRVFPEIAKDIEPSQPIIFTVSGAHFKPLPPSSSEQDAKVKVEWLVSRQPYASTGSDKPDIKLTTSEGLHQDHSWTPWMLYDGRFWFRIRQLTSTPFALRPLQKEHLADFTACLGGRDQLYLKETLRKLAPADVRWTLPAIVRQELDSKDSKEVVVALPTLDLAVKGARNLVEWEVRYKKVEIEKLNYRGTEIM